MHMYIFDFDQKSIFKGCIVSGCYSYVYDSEKTLSDKLRFDAVSTLRQGQGSYVNLMVALCK